MNFKHVIFDMDGLLVDSERLNFEILREDMASDGHALTEAFFINLIGKSYEEGAAILAGAFPGYIYRTDDLLDEYYRRMDTGLLAVRPGVFELLDRLDTLGIKKCIASSNFLDVIGRTVAAVGLAGRFDFIVDAYSVARRKPFPDIYLAAAQYFGVRPAECLVLEDSPPGVTAALAAGCSVVAIPDFLPPSPELAAQCLGVYNSLSEVIDRIHKTSAEGSFIFK